MDSDRLNNIIGPDPTEQNRTIFHSIADSNCLDIMDRIWNYFEEKDLKHILILKNDDGETCLHTLAKYRSGEIANTMISQMVSLGAELNAQDAAGNTVLHIAVRRHHELVEGLLSLCADKEIKYKNGLTAYQIAEQKNDRKMMEMLSTEEENIPEQRITQSEWVSLSDLLDSS